MELRQRKTADDGERALDLMMDMSMLEGSGGSDESVISITMLRQAVQEASSPLPSETSSDSTSTGVGVQWKEGFLDKKTRDMFDGLLPKICDCRVRWKLNRYLVAVGQYVYRFKDDNGTSLKGVPIPLLSANIKLLLFKGEDHPMNEVESPFCFEISTLRKTYTYRAANDAEARDWVHFLNQKKMMAHKEVRHHAKVHPAIAKMDRISKRLYSARMQLDLERARDSHDEAEALLGRTGMNPMNIKSSRE